MYIKSAYTIFQPDIYLVLKSFMKYFKIHAEKQAWWYVKSLKFFELFYSPSISGACQMHLHKTKYHDNRTFDIWSLIPPYYIHNKSIMLTVQLSDYNVICNWNILLWWKQISMYLKHAQQLMAHSTECDFYLKSYF